MIRDAKDYGALNVRMRAQRQRLLSAGTYNVLVMATDVFNLSQMFETTPYKNIICEEICKAYPDVIDIDRRLTQAFVDQFIFYKRFVPDRAKSFIEAYGYTYFLNNLKLIITALHDRYQYSQDTLSMLIKLSPQEDEMIDNFLKARSIEDLISRIEDLPLKEALEESLGEYRYLNLISPLLTAIDQYYYSRIQKEIEKLKGEDKRWATKFFATRIDLQNIETILRSKTLNVDSKVVEKWLLTGAGTLGSSLTKRLLSESSAEEVLRIVRSKTPYREFATRLLEDKSEETKQLSFDNLDLYIDQILAHLSNSIFAGASFNISIFPAFFFLKEIEIRNIRSIILGKIDKRSTKEILDKIVLV